MEGVGQREYHEGSWGSRQGLYESCRPGQETQVGSSFIVRTGSPHCCQKVGDGSSWCPGPRAPSDRCAPNLGCTVNSRARQWQDAGCLDIPFSALSLDQREEETEPRLWSISQDPMSWFHDPLNLPNSPQGK